MSKRGLGVSRDSIFKKTTTEKPVKEKKVQANCWKTCTIQFLEKDKRFLDDLAHFSRKNKRDVLAEMIELYREKNSNPTI